MIYAAHYKFPSDVYALESTYLTRVAVVFTLHLLYILEHFLFLLFVDK